MTREEFEKSPTTMSWDGLPKKAAAEPGCRTCKGEGIVDEGDFACVLVVCPDCWRKK